MTLIIMFNNQNNQHFTPVIIQLTASLKIDWSLMVQFAMLGYTNVAINADLYKPELTPYIMQLTASFKINWWYTLLDNNNTNCGNLC